MSETVKLVIEIDKENYDYLKEQVAQGITNPFKILIANGKPLSEVLDKISAEIDEKISLYEHFSSSNTTNGLMIAKKIIEKYKGDKEC